MIGQKFQDQISLLLIRASLRAKHGLVQVAEEHGLNPMQSLALCVMEPGKPVKMNTLTYPLACDPSHVTGIVDRLEAGGFITRKDSPKDRRIKMIELTESGLTLREKFLRANVDIRMPGLDKLTGAEAKQLVDLIVKTTEIELS
jgi:DNA-binding MarR family transcriptional regulator